MTSQNDVLPAPTPDREELDEQTTCFECRTVIPPFTARLAVTEGIVLCQACCVRRGGEYDHSRAVWVMAPWFEDLTGKQHHV